jgi:hypothetical protein
MGRGRGRRDDDWGLSFLSAFLFFYCVDIIIRISWFGVFEWLSLGFDMMKGNY